MVRARVILNPWSNRGGASKLKDKIVEWGAPYGRLDMVVTEYPGHAKSLARTAADEGYDMVVAAGGDGTVHEVVNGLVMADRAETTLGVIPIGTGNDFAYALKLPTDTQAAVTRLFEGATRRVDLARIEDGNGRFEIVDNGVGIGFDATISIESRNITRLRGFPLYVLATLRTIAFYYQTPRIEAQFDDERVNQETLLLAIGVGPRAGGGFLLTPGANHDDDLLESCMVNPVGRATMLKMLPDVMKGSHIHSRHVTMRHNRRIHLKSNMPLPIHIDGEIFAYPQDSVHEVAITSLPAALPVVC